MKNENYLDIFHDSRPWLARQPDMAPWPEGCRRLTATLGDWVESYSERICEIPVVDGDRHRPNYLTRLWRCLGYHWQHAADGEGGVDVAQVADRLRAGRGWQRGGQLGGDPMRDVILALAMTLGDGNAPRVFEADYHGFTKGLAAKLNRRLADNPDEWWNELLDFLAGYTKPPGKLERFDGKCGLRNWLGTVLWNFLRRWVSREWKLAANEEVETMSDAHPSTHTDAATREAVGLFARMVREALERLPSDDRLLLSLVYLDRMKQNEVAAILRIHPGTVTRRMQKAVERFRTYLEENAADCLSDQSLDGVLDQITEDPKAFAQALCDALEKKREQSP